MDLYTRKLVQADPKAAGSMALLKKGRGGFALDETPVSSGPPQRVAQERPATTLFQWRDATGRLQISDQAPPRGTKGVKVFGGASDES